MSEIIDTYTLVYGELSGRYSAGTTAMWETDQALGSTPTLSMTVQRADGKSVNKFEVTEVHVYMDCTNAVTYQLYLHEDAQAANYLNLANTVFDSGSLRADDTMYKYLPESGKVPFNVDLATDGTLYYSLDWSAAPASTTGILIVRGRVKT